MRDMLLLSALWVLAPAATGTSARPPRLVTAAQDDGALRVVNEVRAALGGARALASIHAMTASGRVTRAVGPLQVEGRVELRLALPERYVRIDRVSIGGRRAEILSGFRGNLLLQRTVRPDGTVATPDPNAPEMAAAAEGARRDAALLLLGFFCGETTSPIQFRYAGAAESPDGRADVLDVTIAGDLHARLFVDERTRLPLFVSWSAPDLAAAARALMSAAATTPQEAAELLAGLPPAEHRIYFGDYRTAGDLVWPFRIRRATGGRTVEELTFDAFRINPALDDRAFEPEP